MGVRRYFKNLVRDFRLPRMRSLHYEGLVIPKDRSGMAGAVLFKIYQKEYERPEILGLSQVIRSGDHVLELGAGLGIITALAGRAAGPRGRVRAYEADVSLLEDTKAFLSSNSISNVDLLHAILVPEPDPAPRTFYLAESFVESSLLGAEGRKPQGSVVVPAESLAVVLADFRPDVLICDIEGAEAELLPALPQSSLRAAVVELHPDRLSPAQIQAIHDAMAALGLHRQQPGPGGTVEIYARTPSQ